MSADKVGYLQRIGDELLILPEWLDSIGYELDVDQGQRAHSLYFDEAEKGWAVGLDQSVVIHAGIALRLGFIGPIWLYLPFGDQCPARGKPGDRVRVHRHEVVATPCPENFPNLELGGIVPRFFLLK